MPADAAQQLDARLEAYERQTKHQLIVWIGKSTEGDSIEDWSTRAVKEWGIGRKGENDGIALIVMADDRKHVLPPRHELQTSMESLIHHFKLVTEGFRVKANQIYYTVESPRGEFGCFLVSDGGPKPWRIHFRAPSFVSLQSTAMMAVNRYIADLIVVVGSLDGVMGEADR